jgi:hypothetical protein
MKGIMMLVSSIAFTSLLAGCGTMSVQQHRNEAQRYQLAARTASARGDVAEAKRADALAQKHEADAVKQEKRDAQEEYNWAP